MFSCQKQNQDFGYKPLHTIMIFLQKILMFLKKWCNKQHDIGPCNELTGDRSAMDNMCMVITCIFDGCCTSVGPAMGLCPLNGVTCCAFFVSSAACGLPASASAMAAATALDEPEEDSVSLEKHLGERRDAATLPDGSDRPLKKLKECTHDSKDGIRWLQTANGPMIPFVLRASSGIVHCGHVEMQVLRNGHIPEVLCLTGCEPAGQCPCYCHLLQSYYNQRT